MEGFAQEAVAGVGNGTGTVHEKARAGFVEDLALEI